MDQVFRRPDGTLMPRPDTFVPPTSSNGDFRDIQAAVEAGEAELIDVDDNGNPVEE